MGALCSSEPEGYSHADTPQTRRRLYRSFYLPSPRNGDGPFAACLVGTQPTLLQNGESAESAVEREVNTFISSESFASATVSRGSSLTDYTGSVTSGATGSDTGFQTPCHNCGCTLKVGSEVILSKSYTEHLDAAHGNLKPGQVGIVSEIEEARPGERMYNVQTVDSGGSESWWFSNCAVQLKRCRLPASCAQNFDVDPVYEANLRAACESSSAVAALACARWNNHLFNVNPG